MEADEDFDKYQVTFQTWNKVAELYQEKFMDIDLYNDTYNLFYELVGKQNARILEIGCGPGNITRYLLSQRPDFIIEGIDIAANMIELARINNPPADFTVMDCRKVDKLTSKFDGIMCGFCIPYLSKEHCIKLIKDCSILLNDRGIFYLSAIEDAYEKSGFEAASTGDKAYVYYYEEDFLRTILTQNDFDIVRLIRKEYRRTPEISHSQMIFVARRNSV